MVDEDGEKLAQERDEHRAVAEVDAKRAGLRAGLEGSLGLEAPKFPGCTWWCMAWIGMMFSMGKPMTSPSPVVGLYNIYS